MASNICTLSAYGLTSVAGSANKALREYENISQNLAVLHEDFIGLNKELHLSASFMADAEGDEPDVRGEANYAYNQATKILTRPFGMNKERVLAEHLRAEAKRLLALADNLDDIKSDLNA